MVAVVLIMMTATFVEKTSGSAAEIYGSWWFAATWALLACSGLLYCLRRRMQQRPVVLMLHLSWVVILAGALITHLWGQQGALHLRVGEAGSVFVSDDGRPHTLPFALTLEDFEVVRYPGTQTAMDYRSTLLIAPPEGKSGEETSVRLEVSMNKIAEYRHYRFYQSQYDADGQGSVLTVSHDPEGIAVTYVGYGLLFLSMVLLLILPGEGFRRSLRRLALIGLLVALPGEQLHAAPVARPKSVTPEEARAFCSLYAYYNGRICPVQTIAKDFTVKLYGRDHCAGYNFEQVFAGWVFYPTSWAGVPRKERKGRFADEQRAVVEMFHAGEFLHLFPHQGRWLSPAHGFVLDLPDEEAFFVKKSVDYLCELVATRQHDRYMETLGKIRKYQQKQAGDVLPSDRHFRAEMLYNRADHTRLLAMAFAALGIVLFGGLVARMARGREIPRWLIRLCNGLIVPAAAYLMGLFALRWYVGGHLPLSNGFETMQFMALCLLLLSLLLQKRFRLAVPFGFLLCGLTLMVSTFGQSNPQITLLMPVLQSPLLSLHVCLIMISYSLLAFAFLNGLASFVLRTEAEQIRLMHVSRMLLYPALFGLAGGIFVGAIWGNVSWGRYWGWDPKEVWALITMLVYSFALHDRSLAWLRRPVLFHLFMVFSFLTVLMTYFGVNFLLGGMHSYA